MLKDLYRHLHVVHRAPGAESTAGRRLGRRSAVLVGDDEGRRRWREDRPFVRGAPRGPIPLLPEVLRLDGLVTLTPGSPPRRPAA